MCHNSRTRDVLCYCDAPEKVDLVAEVFHAVSLMESPCLVCPQHLLSCSSFIVICVKGKFYVLYLLVIEGGVRSCQAGANIWDSYTGVRKPLCL